LSDSGIVGKIQIHVMQYIRWPPTNAVFVRRNASIETLEKIYFYFYSHISFNPNRKSIELHQNSRNLNSSSENFKCAFDIILTSKNYEYKSCSYWYSSSLTNSTNILLPIFNFLSN